MNIVCDSQHQYFVDGIKMPSVSAIIRAMGLVEDRYFTDAARDEGTALHEWCAFAAAKKVPAEPPDLRIVGRFEAFGKFLKATWFHPVGIELSLFDKARKFCGTPDLWGVINKRHAVIDIKGGAECKWHPLQTAAYAVLLGANDYRVSDRYCLYVSDDGTYRLKLHEDHDDMKRWIALVAAYHARGFYINQEAGK